MLRDLQALMKEIRVVDTSFSSFEFILSSCKMLQ